VNTPCRQEVKIAKIVSRQDLHSTTLHSHKISHSGENIFNSYGYYNLYYSNMRLITNLVNINYIKEQLYPKLQGKREFIIEEKLLKGKYKDYIRSLFNYFHTIYIYANDVNTLFCTKGECRGREAFPRRANVITYVGHSPTLLKLLEMYLKSSYVGNFDVAIVMSCDVADWTEKGLAALWGSGLRAQLYILPRTAKVHISDAVATLDCLIRQPS